MNEETFLSALHENPSDEVTWLALADWLEEDGQAERAELVRLVRRLRTLPAARRPPRVALERRIAALLEAGVRPVVPEVVNSVGMRFALVPPGRFRMGSPRSEKLRRPNERPHSVEITRPFYLGVFVVTQRQYETVMGHNPIPDAFHDGDVEVPADERPDSPVGRVSYHEAGGFLEALSKREAGLEPALNYRLPTEAEWEYACRAGFSSPFHFGPSLSGTQANFDGGQPYGKVKKGPFLNRPCAVGRYPPNAFGLYDVHGNVWEWCHDWYAEDYPEGQAVDPTGPTEGSERVIRGGCVNDDGRSCRAAYRLGVAPAGQYGYLGLRAAADWPARAATKA
jgi:uncharacterized protein (TIGR02996 family)